MVLEAAHPFSPSWLSRKLVFKAKDHQMQLSRQVIKDKLQGITGN